MNLLLLLQVRQNCMLDSAPEALAEAEQAILAAQIDSAISSAFSSLVDEHTGLVQEPSQGSDGLTLLSHVSCDTSAVLANAPRGRILLHITATVTQHMHPMHCTPPALQVVPLNQAPGIQ